MTEIAQRNEAGKRRDPRYSRTFSTKEIAGEQHRTYVGGRWDEIGELQRDFLIAQGLQPADTLLDVGCGSLRGGVHFVDYLEAGNYYGIDINANVIAAGYDSELTDEQRDRLPVENLQATDRFDGDFGVQFDMAIAQSVFTHVSLNNIRLCMYRVSKVLKPGGRFYATFYERPPGFPVDGHNRSQFTERNAYWYYRRDLRWVSRFGRWEFRYIGKWGHPRGQRMIELTRVGD
ncbi:class I SAM-dependent methyltransferase [Solicola gregarius]|uniref:Class I SAM-dependent methyltransferase n=1 Tax=Solicola gregarius TaxID=2908642 RepID=A0AA46TM37_9ACTN|nr:class I SAM-dependent methyltransferase [Solicola gregarius]UYM07427.1 class I SAM-dependent methyltransferase [Solicola gregarius]